MTDSARLGTMDDTNRGAMTEPLSETAALEAEGLGDSADVLAVARPILERARDAQHERVVAAYDAGHRDGYDKRPSTPAAHGYTVGADLKAYREGYGDGCQLREDEHLERIERTYPDGAYTIGGHRFA